MSKTEVHPISANSIKNGSQKPILLMCPPEYFAVNYKINPWMKPEEWHNHGDEFKAKADQSWQNLYQVFLSLAVNIELVQPQPNLPDMVFTANSAVVLDGKALMARFLCPERQGEEKYFADKFQYLQDLGMLNSVDTLPDGLIQEGAGDCVWDSNRQLFWAGYGQRSSKDSIQYLQDYFDKEVVALELASPSFYHADVSISVLNSGIIVYYPEAFTKESQKIILERVPSDQLISVDKEDACNFVCNLVNITENIVLRKCSSRLKNILQERGFSVIEVPVDVFSLSGGSVCCLTLRLNWRSQAK